MTIADSITTQPAIKHASKKDLISTASRGVSDVPILLSKPTARSAVWQNSYAIEIIEVPGQPRGSIDVLGRDTTTKNGARVVHPVEMRALTAIHAQARP